LANELTIEINADDSGLQEGLGELKQNLAIVGQSLMDLGTSIQGAFAGVLQGVFETEKGLLKFQNTTGATNAEMKKYGNEIKDLYKSGVGESIDDVGMAMANVKQQSAALGISSPKDLKNITERAMILRDNFEVDIPEATKTAGNLMKNFGMTSEEALDYIAKGFQSGLDQSGDFIDTLYEYSPQFAKMGMSADDMFNILKSGTTAGIFTLDKMGDAVKEFGIRAIDGSENTKKAFSEIGLDADSTAQKLAKGGTEGQKAFFDIVQGLAKIKDPIKQNEMGVYLFGTMWEDLGGKAILGMGKVEGATTKYKGTLDEIKKNTATQDIGKQFEILKRTIEIDVVQPIAAKLLPALKSISDIAKENLPMVKELFSNIPSGVVVAIAAIGGLAAVIVPLIGLWGMLAPAIAAVKVAFAAVGTFIAGISTPVLVVIGVIVALLAVVYIFRDQFMAIFSKIASVVVPLLTSAFNYMKATFMQYIMPIVDQQLPKIQSTFMSVFESVKGHLATVIPFIIEILKGLKPVFEVIVYVLQGLWSAMLIVFGNIIAFLGSTISNIITLIGGFMNTITGIINLVLGVLSGDWSRAWEGIKMIVIGVFQMVKAIITQAIAFLLVTIGSGLEIIFGIFNRIFPGISDKAREMWNRIKQFFSEGASNIKTTLINVLQSLPDTIGNIGSSIYNAGGKLIDQLVNGIKAGINKVKSICKDVTNAIADFFPHSPAKEGALKTFPQVGYTLMEQLMAGIEGSQNQLNAITANVASDINGNINTSVNTNNGNNQAGITVPIYLDGKKISEVTTPYMVRALRQQGF
jgi:phage-related minor tail protein